jgi:5-methylcytosine-specific restriction endonuclease McrA
LKFELQDSFRGATNEELLDELRRAAKVAGRDTITISEFEQYGKCHPCTMQRRFGSWTSALNLAGLKPSRSKIGIEDAELFENIRAMWISLGRQPRYSEVGSPDSKYSAGTYEKRFGSWTKALKAFVKWVNSDESNGNSVEESAGDQSTQHKSRKKPLKKRTRREISDRQRFRILVRDGFRCMACGASPLKQPGIELHVDHIVPWSKGGETTDDNLQCKCSKCNLGKGNEYNA